MSALRELWRLHRAADRARLQPHVASDPTFVSFYVHHGMVDPPLCWLSAKWTPDGHLLSCLRTQRTLEGPLRTVRLTVDEAVDWVTDGMPL